MPFHIFISQWAGTSLGGLEAWKVGKDLITMGLLALTGVLVLLKVRRHEWQPFTTLLILAAVYAVLHILLYVGNWDTSLATAALGSTYNNRLVWIFLIATGAGLLARRSGGEGWLVRFVLIVSTAVCVLGLAQWFLPKDILEQFGYDPALGVKPTFFINEDPDFPRVFATFRDPNSFGAYLIIPILLLVQLLVKRKNRLLLGVCLGLHLVVLYLSFSRAAWGGLVVGLLALLLISHRQKTRTLLKRFWPVLLGLAIAGCVGVYAIKDTSTFRSIVLKADDTNAATAMDSDEYHWHYIQEGARGVADKPLGHGPGTAGVVSIRNGDDSQLTENYYIQIAYEVGLVGLLVFVAIWGLVIRFLVQQVRRSPSVMGYTLLASAVAYAVMSMVMHLWTNEAVAYAWWGLAGLTLDFLTNKERTKPA